MIYIYINMLISCLMSQLYLITLTLTYLQTCMYILYYQYNVGYLPNNFYSSYLNSCMHEFGLIRANSKCTNLERTAHDPT